MNLLCEIELVKVIKSKGVTCPGLPSPSNGRVTPSSCLSTSYYGDSCVFSCNEGDYVRSGPQVQTCTVSGIWSQQGITTSCVFRDTTPPVFTKSCPVEITVTVITPCSNQAVVTVDQPAATDNSGVVTVTPSTSEPEVLNVGRYERNFRAEDNAGNSAECRVVIIVQGIYCSAPPQIAASGYIASTSCLHTFGSVATYQCYPGYRLVGDDEVQCGMDGSWNGIVPICQEVRCDTLIIPPNGNASPFTCTGGSVSTGTQCSLWCDTGFVLNGADALVTCRANGTWSNDLTNAACNDVRAPIITNCPSSFAVNLPPSSASVVVTWSIPTATSGGQPIAVANTANVTPPTTLGPGSHLVEYVARDSESRESFCRFTIEVNDIESPVVTSCPPEPIIVQTTRIPLVLEWTEPAFADNVDVIEVYQDGTPGKKVYSWGRVSIRYAAYDAAGNTAECIVIIHVIQSASCPPLQPPVNGALDCQDSTCTAQCNEGFVFTNRNRPRGAYVCLPSGMWNHATPENPTPELPACVENTLENSLILSREDMVLLQGAICNPEVEQQTTSVISTILDNSSFMTTCYGNSDNNCGIGNINTDCNSAEGRRRKKRQMQDIVVHYELTGTRNDSTDTAALEQAMAIPASDLISAASIVVNVNGQDVTLNVVETETGLVKATCEPGQELTGMFCVYCPVGSSFDLTTSGCSPCEVGTYQDKKGQLICKPCPDGTTTAGTGSYSNNQCEESCTLGEYSYIGLTPCQLCPRGTFQPKTGQRGCEPCAQGYSTIRSGSTSYEQCRAIGSFTPIFSTPLYTTAEPATKSSEVGDEIPLTAIVVGAVAVLTLVLIVVGVACCTCKRKRFKMGSKSDRSELELYDVPPDAHQAYQGQENQEHMNNRFAAHEEPDHFRFGAMNNVL
ncbi:sushi, von Willebrand factor type A, EGF and pentraxin domain-containing protein 1-like [Amphiura filiformis]|uniref:sushi, von Willebrand factor type A, EGF and pentraxin domain-containing protein 1-like n=1 Tax=Amphiura filiformis TaxID=82378 RepID=UPI003B220260